MCVVMCVVGVVVGLDPPCAGPPCGGPPCTGPSSSGPPSARPPSACETPVASGARPENSKRAHLTAPALPNTTKNPREDPQRETKRSKLGAGDGKKKHKILGPHPSGRAITHTRSRTWIGQNWIGPNWIGQNWIGQKLIGQKLIGQKWIGQTWIGPNWSNQEGQNGIGQSRSLPLQGVSGGSTGENDLWFQGGFEPTLLWFQGFQTTEEKEKQKKEEKRCQTTPQWIEPNAFWFQGGFRPNPLWFGGFEQVRFYPF